MSWVHPSAVCDAGCEIGEGTRIWHFSHVMSGARIGRDCSIGQGCFVAGTAVIGDRVRVQNHVSVFDAVSLGDDVFVGPGVVFTNVKRPRSEFPVKPHYQSIRVERGATLGANSTILCGVRLGPYCLVGAGAVVTRDAPAFARLVGAPARVVGWVSRRACDLHFDAEGTARCPEGGELYRLERGCVRLSE